MKAPDFLYLRAGSMNDALDALGLHGDDAMVLAGGQSLMAMHNLRIARAGVLVDINRIPGLDTIREEGDHLVIGCLARYAQLESHPLVRQHLPLIAAALPHVAHDAIRNRGTLGGSLALSDPAAEMPACCLALDATMVAQSRDGLREIPADDFFTGLYETALSPAEILREVRIPKVRQVGWTHFAEVSRRRGDFAVAGIAFAARRGPWPLAGARLAVFGAGERALLAREATALLSETAPRDVTRASLHEALASDVTPLDAPGCPAAYRAQVLRVLVSRLLDALREVAP